MKYFRYCNLECVGHSGPAEAAVLQLQLEDGRVEVG